MKLLLSGLFVLAAPMAFAGTEWEEDQLIINRINATDFEVVETQDMGPGAFWCGAASFHERRMGRSGRDMLYVKQPRGPSVTRPGSKGVVFTTDAARVSATGASGSVSVSRAGDGFRSSFARSLCRDAFTRATK